MLPALFYQMIYFGKPARDYVIPLGEAIKRSRRYTILQCHDDFERPSIRREAFSSVMGDFTEKMLTIRWAMIRPTDI